MSLAVKKTFLKILLRRSLLPETSLSDSLEEMLDVNNGFLSCFLSVVVVAPRRSST